MITTQSSPVPSLSHRYDPLMMTLYSVCLYVPFHQPTLSASCTYPIPCIYPIPCLVCVNRSIGSSDKESSCSLSSEKGHSHSSDEKKRNKAFKSISSSTITTPSYHRSSSNYFFNNSSFFSLSFYELILLVGFMLAFVCLSYSYIYKWDSLRMSLRHGQEALLLGQRVYQVTIQLILYLWNFTPNQEH